MRYCPECGEKLLKKDEKFCSECGAALASKAQKAAAAQAPAEPEPSAGKPAQKKPFGVREMALVAAGVLILALFVNWVLSAVVGGIENGRQVVLQLQMEETLQKYGEDLSRAQIDADAAKAAQLKGEFAQFMQTVSYDTVQMATSVQQYNMSEKITDRNLAAKAAAAKQFALQVNEFKSHIGGLKAFAIDNWADIAQISGGQANMSEKDLSSFDSAIAKFADLELKMAGELEAFAGTGSSRMAIASDAIRTLRESAGSS